MRKRSMSEEKENSSVLESKSESSQKQKRPKETFYTVEEFVRDDVYLLNRKSKVDKNLLANSLTAKLKQHIPGEISTNGELMNKIRRESLKDLVQLNNLNKQLKNEMDMETNRIDSQSHQLIRRHEQMRKQSEYLRKNQDKIRSQIRGKSGPTNSKMSSLPSLKTPPAGYVGSVLDTENRELYSRASSRDSAKQRKELKSNFHMFPKEYDNDDPTYVKHFKHMGLFQPHNKYHSINEKQYPEKSILRKSYAMPDYEILTLSMKDSDLYSEDGSSISSKMDQKSQKKKGLRVTWTGVQHEADDRSTSYYTQSQSPTESVSVKSFKSDSVIQSAAFTKTGKSKLDSIGIKWKLPPQGMRAASQSASTRSRKVSHNLMPCTSAMNKYGTSVTKQKWAVSTMTANTSTYELYKNWLEKLEHLKSPLENKVNNKQKGVNQTTNESVSYTVPVTTERPTVSLYTV